MKALIIVDVQNDFLPGGALAVPEGGEVVPVINRLQERFGLVVATQDWHPVAHGSFAASHPGKKPGDSIDLFGLPQTLWPVHCVENTAGADFAPGLEQERWAHIVRKGLDPAADSYSGFYDNGRRHATDLGAFLRRNAVTKVYVAGLATDYCVKFTALDARAEGFAVFLIEDACRGVNLQPGDVDRAVEEMRAAGGRTIQSGQVDEI